MEPQAPAPGERRAQAPIVSLVMAANGSIPRRPLPPLATSIRGGYTPWGIPRLPYAGCRPAACRPRSRRPASQIPPSRSP
jgi:hypothetical protein